MLSLCLCYAFAFALIYADADAAFDLRHADLLLIVCLAPPGYFRCHTRHYYATIDAAAAFITLPSSLIISTALRCRCRLIISLID